VAPRITRRGYTCQPLHTAEIKAYQCEKTIVYRESSRSGRWSSKATRDSRAGGPCCRLSSLFLSPSFLRIRPPTYLFLSPSLAPFLPRLLLYFCSFCPFSASANDSRLFISRLCIARDRARVLLRLLATAELPLPLLPSILSFDPFLFLPFFVF